MVLTIYDETILAGYESGINDSDLMIERTTFRILHDFFEIMEIICNYYYGFHWTI